MVRPVFRKGRIVAYTLSITHLPDVGGSGFGSSAAEVYHEGLRLPICKLYEEGRLNELLIEIIRTNVRVPEQVIGDVMANVACNEVGGREILAFMDEYGLDDLTALSRAIRGQSEAAMRAKIRELGDGTYRNRIAGRGFRRAVRLRGAHRHQERQRRLRFHGHLGLRAGRRQRALLLYQRDGAARHQVAAAAEHPQQRGLDRADLGVRAARLHPQRAAALRHRRAACHGAFRDAAGLRRAGGGAPDRVQAGSGMMNLITFQGMRRDGRPFSTIYFAAGGYGALEDLDGWCTLPHPSNMAVVPVEVWETLTHTTIESKRLLPDSGGPGPLARRPRAGGRPAQRHRPSGHHARHGQPHDVSRARHVRRRRRVAARARDRRQARARQGPQRTGARASACASSRPAAAATATPRQRAPAPSPRTSRRATSAPTWRETSTACATRLPSAREHDAG